MWGLEREVGCWVRWAHMPGVAKAPTSGAGAGHRNLGHVLSWASRMLSLGLSTFPFFNQTRRGSGTPCATQVNMAPLLET